MKTCTILGPSCCGKTTFGRSQRFQEIMGQDQTYDVQQFTTYGMWFKYHDTPESHSMLEKNEEEFRHASSFPPADLSMVMVISRSLLLERAKHRWENSWQVGDPKSRRDRGIAKNRMRRRLGQGLGLMSAHYDLIIETIKKHGMPYLIIDASDAMYKLMSEQEISKIAGD